MKKLLFAFLLSLFAVTSAVGQSVQSFVHDFGDYKVYQRVGNAGEVSWITSVKVKNRDCKQVFVSPIKIQDNRIVFRGGTVWKVKKAKDGMKLELPDGKTVLYKYTEENPLEKFCKPDKKT